MSDDTNTHTPIVELVWAHKNALSTIEKQNKIIALLEKSNDHYAEIDNWEPIDVFGEEKPIMINEIDYTSDKFGDVFGGKLARETKKKVKELRSEE